MKITKKISMVIALMLILIAVYAFGSDSSQEGRGRGHNGPPPEAYTACEGKEAGDTAEFVSPHGDTVTGTCVLEGDRLVLRPDNPPERGSRGRRPDDTDE